MSFHEIISQNIDLSNVLYSKIKNNRNQKFIHKTHFILRILFLLNDFCIRNKSYKIYFFKYQSTYIKK